MATPEQSQPWMATPKTPLWKKWWVWLIAGFAVLFILAGIFGSGDSNDASDSDEVVEEVDPMPDLLGARLDVALSDLDGIGFGEDDVELVGGGSFGILDESNWFVCEQRPEPGATTFDNLRLIVDRTCPDTSADAPSETEEETVATDSFESDVDQGTVDAPESPATFVVSARRDLRDIRKDLNDLETAFSEGGILRVAGNQVELAFNMAQLNLREAPEDFADTWTERLAATSLAIDEVDNRLDSEAAPQAVIEAIDNARDEVRTTLDAVKDFEGTLGE